MKALKYKTLGAELAHAYALHYKIKAPKCKTLGVEVTHAHSFICAFYSDDHVPTYISLLTQVGQRGNFND